MIALLLASVLALASPADDLSLAARKDAPEAVRMAAFDRLVSLGAVDLALVRQAAAAEDWDARERWVAVRVLGQVGGDAAREALLVALDDGMPAMRVAAASALGDLGDALAVAPLIARLADPALLVRAAAAGAPGMPGDPSAVQPLATSLAARDNFHRGQSLWVRRHFALALGGIGDSGAYPALLRALDDGDPTVAEAAVDAFELIAGFSFGDGRDAAAEREAWRRWAASKLR